MASSFAGYSILRIVRDNEQGQIVAWDWNTANTPDKHFHPLVSPWVGETIVSTPTTKRLMEYTNDEASYGVHQRRSALWLADFGFRSAEGHPENMKLCPKGAWNERMIVETALSMVICEELRGTKQSNQFLATVCDPVTNLDCM